VLVIIVAVAVEEEGVVETFVCVGSKQQTEEVANATAAATT
jgi:hypothetical protein